MLSHTNPSTVLFLNFILQQIAAALSIANSNILVSPAPALSLSQTGTETETLPPCQNLLTYLSTTHAHPNTSTPISSSTASFSSICTSFLSRDKTTLLLPNARIPLSPAGFIDCFLEKPEPQGSQGSHSQEQGQDQYQYQDHQQKESQLVFKGIPADWQFSVTEITVAGWLDLERGSFVERVEVGVWYFPGVHQMMGITGADRDQQAWVNSGVSGGIWNGDEHIEDGQHGEAKSANGNENENEWKWDLKREELRKTRRGVSHSKRQESRRQAQVDHAISLTPYGRYGTGYQGTFNLSMPVKPGKRELLALSPCSTGPEMEIALGAELWFSLSHEQIDFDDMIVHRGRLGGEAGEGEGEEGDDGDEKTLRVGVTGRWARC